MQICKVHSRTILDDIDVKYIRLWFMIFIGTQKCINCITIESFGLILASNMKYFRPCDYRYNLCLHATKKKLFSYWWLEKIHKRRTQKRFSWSRPIQRTGQNECYFILIHCVVSNSAIRIVLQITNCILVCIHLLHEVIISCG